MPIVGHCWRGCNAAAIKAAILDVLRNDMPTSSAMREAARETDSSRIARARRIWERSVSAWNTIAERYLRSRGIILSPPKALRFLTRCRHANGATLPALIAAVTIEGKGITGCQRIYLRGDGLGKAPVQPAKASLGIIRGGAVRLAPVGVTLALAEGVETALSFMQLEGVPCWATCGAGFLEQVILPELPAASTVVIAIDNDAASEIAAERATTRFWSEGRHVRIARPIGGNDFNDLL